MKMLLTEYLLVLVSRSDLPYIIVNMKFLDGYSVKIDNASFRWSNHVDDPLDLKKSADETRSVIHDE